MGQEKRRKSNFIALNLMSVARIVTHFHILFHIPSGFKMENKNILQYTSNHLNDIQIQKQAITITILSLVLRLSFQHLLKISFTYFSFKFNPRVSRNQRKKRKKKMFSVWRPTTIRLKETESKTQQAKERSWNGMELFVSLFSSFSSSKQMCGSHEIRESEDIANTFNLYLPPTVTRTPMPLLIKSGHMWISSHSQMKATHKSFTSVDFTSFHFTEIPDKKLVAVSCTAHYSK